MDEIIFRYIDRFGFPVVMALIWAYTAFKLFGKYEIATERAAAASEALRVEAAHNAELALATAAQYKTLSDKNTAAMEANTAAAKDQTDYLRKFGSDPAKLCQAMAALTQAGLKCSAEEVLSYLKQKEKRKAGESDTHKE